MTLDECLKQLALGKLSNTSFAENGKIIEDKKEVIVSQINEALLRLYTLFPIKEKSIIIELYEGRTEYPLTSDHSVRKATGLITDPYDFYIMDTEANPFQDDILTIMSVWDDIDRKRPLNDPENILSVMTPQPNVIEVNVTATGRVLNIIYRAKHLILTPNKGEDKVELPANLFGALFSYVAYLIHSSMNTKEAVENAQKYLVEYQNIVNEIIQNQTFTPDKLTLDKKFICRGWV